MVEVGRIGSRKSFLVGAIFLMGAEGICQCIKGGDKALYNLLRVMILIFLYIS